MELKGCTGCQKWDKLNHARIHSMELKDIRVHLSPRTSTLGIHSMELKVEEAGEGGAEE